MKILLTFYVYIFNINTYSFQKIYINKYKSMFIHNIILR